jgi:hypothetical protein
MDLLYYNILLRYVIARDNYFIYKLVITHDLLDISNNVNN